MLTKVKRKISLIKRKLNEHVMKNETEIQSWLYVNTLSTLQEHNGALAVVQNGTTQCTKHRSLQYCTAHERQSNS